MARCKRSDVVSAVPDEAELMRRARLMLMALLSTVDDSPLWDVRRKLERVLAISGPRSARSPQPLADRVRAAEALLEGHALTTDVRPCDRGLSRSSK